MTEQKGSRWRRRDSPQTSAKSTASQRRGKAVGTVRPTGHHQRIQPAGPSLLARLTGERPSFSDEVVRYEGRQRGGRPAATSNKREAHHVIDHSATSVN